MCGSGLVSWKLAKEKGERLFKAEYGGSYDVFNQRPIPEDISSYCVGDVQYIPELRNRLYKSAYQWRDLVGEETKKRVATSQRSDYQPHAPDKVMAPWSKEQNMVLDQWNYVPPFNYFAEPSDSDDGYDGGPTNCRDIIDDYDLYYSD
jgi:exonuclease 3'-5' domain-containing protein 1